MFNLWLNDSHVEREPSQVGGVNVIIDYVLTKNQHQLLLLAKHMFYISSLYLSNAFNLGGLFWQVSAYTADLKGQINNKYMV